MKLKLSKYHIYWIVIWLFVFSYLTLVDAVFSRDILHVKNFNANQFGISYIFPLGRTEVLDDRQVILDEPVYFTTYAPLKYSEANINLLFSEPPEGWKIGVQTGPGFSYALNELSNEVEQEIRIDSSGGYFDANRLRFIFSNDNDELAPLEIRYLSVSLLNPGESYLEVIKRNIINAYENITSIF